MAPSQLKQLKASIRTRREANGKPKQPQSNSQRQNAPKSQQQNKKRPKSQGEQNRRLTLLPELQRRHKVGGIVDRRIGENDPTMAPEERAIQRYTRQRSKRDSMFNLEEVDGEDELTHLGRSVLSGMDNDVRDDYEEDDQGLGNEEDDEFMKRATKKRRLSNGELESAAEDDNAENQPDRKKSKKEVMEEVMAKSKFHRYERQQAKDEDEEIRETLDKGLPDLLTILRGGGAQHPRMSEQPNGSMVHPERASQIAGDHSGAHQSAEKEYDMRIRQLAQDKRAQPTERTKTADEKAEAEAIRLRELEAKRMRRMRGETVDSDDEDDGDDDEDDEENNDTESVHAAVPELEATAESKKRPFDVEDEDDFVIDADLVASGSDVDTDFSDESGSEKDDDRDDSDDSDFLRDVLPESSSNGATTEVKILEHGKPSSLPYTYACPKDHSELLKIVKGVPLSDLPVVIQRIRALYHPQLNAQNTERLARFAVALVDHLSFLGSQNAPLEVVENLIRHVHSLSRKYADATATAFRAHLIQIQGRLTISTGDLFILTAIGSVYPTSDHFHQVVTPAITIIARWLGMTLPQTDQESKVGAYLVALAIKYQTLSKRYIPETLKFTVAALKRNSNSTSNRSHITNLTRMMDLWSDKAAFIEIFSPSALAALESAGDKAATQKLRILLSQSQLRRRPLELHHHRPLPIRMAIPKFEEGFNPDKHYDPDRERAESNKLRKEYKREKKGALRELKKDASFIAREKLKAKKEADKAYEAKQRRLIAEIQGEDGREKNAYEREKRKRKGIR